MAVSDTWKYSEDVLEMDAKVSHWERVFVSDFALALHM